LSMLPDLEMTELDVESAFGGPPTIDLGAPVIEPASVEDHRIEASPVIEPDSLDGAGGELEFLVPPSDDDSQFETVVSNDEIISLEAEAPKPRSFAPTPASQPTIVTETMALLYLEQGFRAEAVEVYRKLVAQDPSDTALRERFAAVMRKDTPRSSMEFDVPADATEDTSERPPANSMLAEVSFDDLALSTPAAADPTPPDTLSGTGPTAREFFAAFAQRTVTTSHASASASAGPSAPVAVAPEPQTSWAYPAAISSLDDLFGGEVSDEDQRAANFLAGVGTVSAPSGTSNFDSLFASREPQPEPSSGPSRSGVPRASEKLKFDQFFSASSAPSAPAQHESPEQSMPSQSSPAQPDAASGPQDDDLDQFQGWLKGLTQ